MSRDDYPIEPDTTPCKYCGRPDCVHERCQKCGYTSSDASFHGDHNLCGEPEPAKPKDVKTSALEGEDD